jgi:hypothetical protein
MTVATTSIENYHEHKGSGRLGKQSRELIEFIAQHTDRDWSRAELAEQTGLRLSSVCGRINELIHSRHLDPQPNRRCQITGKTVSPVRLRGLF